MTNDPDRKDLAACLELFATGATNGRLRGVFAVAIADDGPLQVVFVEPEDREALIIGINEELTRMLGEEHHVVSTKKLQEFLNRHNISDKDLIEFKASKTE